jgi:hypothetical protein
MITASRDEKAIECMVEVEIDTDRIAEYFGRRALRNKSRQARALHGMLRVKVRPTSENAK